MSGTLVSSHQSAGKLGIGYRKKAPGIGEGTSEEREPGLAVFLPLFWWQVVVIRVLAAAEHFFKWVRALHMLML